MRTEGDGRTQPPFLEPGMCLDRHSRETSCTDLILFGISSSPFATGNRLSSEDGAKEAPRRALAISCSGTAWRQPSREGRPLCSKTPHSHQQTPAYKVTPGLGFLE